MLNITYRDRKTNIWVREKTKFTDVIELVKRRKWTWAGHVSRIRDNRWTLRIITWKPYERKRQRKAGEKLERRTRRLLQSYYLADDSARQTDVEAACLGLRPSTGHLWLHNNDDDVYQFINPQKIKVSVDCDDDHHSYSLGSIHVQNKEYFFVIVMMIKSYIYSDIRSMVLVHILYIFQKVSMLKIDTLYQCCRKISTRGSVYINQYNHKIAESSSIQYDT